MKGQLKKIFKQFPSQQRQCTINTNDTAANTPTMVIIRKDSIKGNLTMIKITTTNKKRIYHTTHSDILAKHITLNQDNQGQKVKRTTVKQYYTKQIMVNHRYSFLLSMNLKTQLFLIVGQIKLSAENLRSRPFKAISFTMKRNKFSSQKTLASADLEMVPKSQK